MRQILIDSGILLSYYQQQEPLHEAVVAFFDQNAAQLITSPRWDLCDQPGSRGLRPHRRTQPALRRSAR